MKISHLMTILGTAAGLVLASAERAQAQTLETMPPVVVKTSPVAGSDNVASDVVEIKVTFSKPMTDNSWSWSSAWKDSTPESIGKPHYESDHKTCVLKAKLQPNTTYGFWINSQKFTNFKDVDGRPAVPYLLTFKTKDK